MKKSFAILLVLVLLLTISGCRNNSTASDPTTPSILNEDPTTPTQKNHPLMVIHSYYRSFEKLIEDATNIIIATYTGEAVQYNKYYYYLTFSPVQQLKGSEIDGNFHVCINAIETEVEAGGGSYITRPEDVNKYIKGNKYLLLLCKNVSVYDPYDIYVLSANTFIEEGKAPTVYQNAPVGQHTTPMTEIKDFDQAVAYTEAILEKGVDSSRVIGRDYIRSTDLSEVVAQTPIVVEVIPSEFKTYNELNSTEQYLCEVTSFLKGSIPDECMNSDTSITIQFMAETVEIGSKYIVLLAYDYAYIQPLSSKISVYRSDTTHANLIKAMIQNSSAGK